MTPGSHALGLNRLSPQADRTLRAAVAVPWPGMFVRGGKEGCPVPMTPGVTVSSLPLPQPGRAAQPGYCAAGTAAAAKEGGGVLHVLQSLRPLQPWPTVPLYT